MDLSSPQSTTEQPAPEFCHRCGKKLNPNKIVWLTLDTRTGTYTDEEIPTEFDQGGFEFGRDCAEVEKRLHQEAVRS